MARTRETTLSWAARLRREEVPPRRAVSGGDADVAWCCGPDQNWAGGGVGQPGGLFYQGRIRAAQLGPDHAPRVMSLTFQFCGRMGRCMLSN